ncbi:hypothetical protein Sme01_39530 [Sphaerisporangium melleum]|uniref:Uncharacterized protein n=1 Tax=Sphaerisporangium melleum TaxID=321316 RepID=A0A917VI83_9ACTN|nr:hypothetical protein [Sphaerisporangium melleum]GGK86179.1 hypothetical protein GCM10007964_30950 [Sphaerisporangium melleum]GII71477.1 hypothetical protein Sme01_39530 [Sphaerisporangium melleum]
MDEHRTGRRPYGDPVWPPPEEEGLPPSARLYGAPATPSGVRVPFWVRRTALFAAAVAVGAALVAGVVAFVAGRLNQPAVPVVVQDGIAGVSYTAPPGWRLGTVPPVTGFTSAVTLGESAVVMARPGDGVPTGGPRAAALQLADVYGRLLLHGDTVGVVDDRAVEANGWTGHSRALRATYSDVVNQPSYLRVTLLTKDGESVVMLGLAQPDTPERRAEMDAVLAGVR